MADERARGLERQGRVDDSPAARAAALLARARAGDQGALERLELAAWLGPGAEREMLGRVPVAAPGFSAAARAVIEAAQAAADRTAEPCVDLHLLAALAERPGPGMLTLLASFWVNLSRDVGEPLARVAHDARERLDRWPFERRFQTVTPATDLVATAYDERVRLGDPLTGTEHLLLAVLLHDGDACGLLKFQTGLAYDDTREQLRDLRQEGLGAESS
ncbi:MAG: Clp protease N-terminal domain-containing protein [Planctomycetes bacterium]|nr:Clp protease N-terminal domain-containing protein [Planctomycetota bacterium]